MTAVRTLDPITTEIVRSAFSAAADEMNATLIRSAYTPIIYEMKDCSVALLDADHRVLGQSAGLPIFLGNLEICTRLTEEMYGREGWQPFVLSLRRAHRDLNVLPVQVAQLA